MKLIYYSCMCEDCIYRDFDNKAQHWKCDNCCGLITNGDGDEFDDNFSHVKEKVNWHPLDGKKNSE